MAIIRESYYIYLRNLRVWLSQPINLISPAVLSAFFFLVFAEPLSGVTGLPGFPAGDYRSFLTAAIMVQAVVFSGSDAAFALVTDILSGYFDKLLLAPINRFSILMGSLLIAGTRALVQAVVVVVLALGLGVSFKGGVAGILFVLLLVTVFGIANACLALAIALRTKSVQVTQSIWLLLFPFIFLTTAFMPKEFLTGWFKMAVTANPFNYVLEGVRTIIIKGWEWNDILVGVAVLAGMTLIFVTGTVWAYRRATA